MNTRKPDFFIIGSAKCGTTSMDEWLRAHPAIFMAEKEPHYFNTDHKNRKITRQHEYRMLFREATDAHLAVGETSVRYIYSGVAVRNILRYNRATKFIVMLRNPLDLVYSWHNQVYFNGTENVKKFETAWHLQTQRKAGKKIPPRCTEVKMLLYGEVGCLGEQLQRLYSQVSAARVHIIVFDDLQQNPAQVYRSVLNFLQVPEDNKQYFVHHNPAKTYYCYTFNSLLLCLRWLKLTMHISKNFGVLKWLRELNITVKKRRPLSPAMKQTLVQYFQEDIKLLERLIGRDLTHWLN